MKFTDHSLSFKKLVHYSVISLTLLFLNACALKSMMMPAYTPPPKIVDFINQQYALAGEIPPEADLKKRSEQAISVQTQDEGELIQISDDEQVYILEPPIQRYRPRYTYKGIEDYAAQLAMSLVKNGNGLDTRAMIGVSSFVRLDESLQNTTVLGNQLAEFSISEIQQFGLNVIDYKLMPAIHVKKNGDLAFSRDVTQLSEQNHLNHVMSGTLIEKRNGVFVNARIIEVATNRVISTASVLIPKFVIEQSQLQFVQN